MALPQDRPADAPDPSAERAANAPTATLVSCLMVTLANDARVPFACRAVADYCRQTHPVRELVIVLDRGSTSGRKALLDYVQDLERPDIRVFDGKPATSLGGLRNRSRVHARGSVLCQWDDDDMHHPERVARQLHALDARGSEAVCLEETMQYFPAAKHLYCINWRATKARSLPGTIMLRAAAPVSYPETGPESERGEDTAILDQLHARQLVAVLAGTPYLYVYVSHGANTWSADHHVMLSDTLAISQALLKRREALLRAGLAPFSFPPDGIVVTGYNGPAFRLEAGTSAAPPAGTSRTIIPSR
ncbi:MAG: glycosyltransferase family A protein [Casimicrobiaceae bacterium]